MEFTVRRARCASVCAGHQRNRRPCLGSPPSALTLPGAGGCSRPAAVASAASMGANKSAARSMKDTRVPIAIGMPRCFKSRRVLSSGVSSENFVITSQASHSHVTFERAYGAGSERGVVRFPQSRHLQVVRVTTRRRWWSLTTSSFSSSMTSAASRAALPQCAHASGSRWWPSTGRCFGSALRPVGGGRGFLSFSLAGNTGGLGRVSKASFASPSRDGDGVGSFGADGLRY